MLTWEVSKTRQFSRPGLFSPCPAASTGHHIYPTQQSSSPLSPFARCSQSLPYSWLSLSIGMDGIEVSGGRSWNLLLLIITWWVLQQREALASFLVSLPLSLHVYPSLITILNIVLEVSIATTQANPICADPATTVQSLSQKEEAEKLGDVWGWLQSFFWSEAKGPAVSSKDGSTNSLSFFFFFFNHRELLFCLCYHYVPKQ